MSAIKCGQCGHENDDTRVFCQNCGGRLERAEAGPTSPKITPVPVKRSSKPKGPSAIALILQFLRGVVTIIVLAAVLALFIQFGRSPDGIPQPVTVNDQGAAQLFEGMKSISTGAFRRVLELKPEQINNFLAAKIAAVESTGGTGAGAQFKRTFVVLGENKFRYYVERTYLGLSVYFWTDYEPLAGPEGATALFKGGGIGRMPVHPVIFSLVQSRVIAPTYGAMPDVLDVLGKADQVKVQPELVQLSWAPKQPNR